MNLAARAAQQAWSRQPVAERARCAGRVAAFVARDTGPFERALAALPSRSGPAESLTAEIAPFVAACRWLAVEGPRLLAPRRLGRRGRPVWLSGVDAEIVREPHGIVLVIGPSNYPLLLPGVHALQALVAGNAVLWKPGRGGTAAAREVARAAIAAGIDADLLAVLPEEVAAATAAIDAGVDKVVLTGSAEVGRALLGKLARQLVPAVVELSGCDAAFVREDADVALAARAVAFGVALNGGASCIGPRRALVHRPLAAAFEARIVEELSARRVRLGEAAPLSLAQTLAGEAVAAGARLIAGRLDPGRAKFPLVLADVPRGAALLARDVFAPVLSIVPVDGDDDALDVDEACPYALGASIFGRVPGARALAARVRAGSVVVNDVIVPTADPRLPFGGRGESGFGRTRGDEGLLEMTVAKAISLRRGRLFHLEPERPSDPDLFRAWLRLAHGGSLGERRGGLGALSRVILGRLRRS